MKEKMKLWNAVCKTNPKHTKHVKVRGGFTAIDAMYQMQCATEQFGAAGEGWGWSFTDPIFLPNDTVVIKCILWHGDRNNTVEQFGQKKMGTNDEDALKKAGTDALTKCLSYLGFNADVFLGKFDDNKYVQGLQAEFKADAEMDEQKREYKQLKDIMHTTISDCHDLGKLNDVWNRIASNKKLNGADKKAAWDAYKIQHEVLAEQDNSDANPLIELN